MARATSASSNNHAAPVTLLANGANLTIDFGCYKSTLIQLVKRTNATNNNAPTGPQVLVGFSVTWTYSVTIRAAPSRWVNVRVDDERHGGSDRRFLADFLYAIGFLGTWWPRSRSISGPPIPG